MISTAHDPTVPENSIAMPMEKWRSDALQTLALEEGKDLVLSLTLKDGSNVKYLIKSPPADTLDAATKEGISKQKVSSYDMEQSGTVLSVGESPLPPGVALKVSIDPTAKKD
ncbi:MAG TPA: hypothetical protein VIE89_24095 [Candidatus Binatia bacterium]